MEKEEKEEEEEGRRRRGGGGGNVSLLCRLCCNYSIIADLSS